jgi:HAMP domain-containing protein
MELKKIRRVVIAFGAIVLVLVITAFVSATNSSRATSITLDLISLQEVGQAADKIGQALEEERIAIGQYPLSGDDLILSRIEAAQADYDQNWTVIAKNLSDQQPQLIADIIAARETYQGMLNEVVTEYQANPDNNASANKLRDAINYYLQNLNPKYDDLIDPQLEKLANLTENERANATRNSIVASSVLVLSILVGISVIVAVALAFIFSRRLIDAITSLVNASNAISRGDLDIPIDVDQGGEIGELAASIDRMRTSLKAAIERLRR